MASIAHLPADKSGNRINSCHIHFNIFLLGPYNKKYSQCLIIRNFFTESHSCLHKHQNLIQIQMNSKTCFIRTLFLPDKSGLIKHVVCPKRSKYMYM